MKKSKTKRIGSTEYCVYCGEIADSDSDVDEYTVYTSYYCDCIHGKKEQEANKILEELKDVEYATKFQVLYDREYEQELYELKCRYGKDDD